MSEARFDCARIGMAFLCPSAASAERESKEEDEEEVLLTDVDAVVFAALDDEGSDHSPLLSLTFDKIEEAAAGVEGLEASYPPD